MREEGSVLSLSATPFVYTPSHPCRYTNGVICVIYWASEL